MVRLNTISKKGINRLIFRSIMELTMVVLCLILSYIVFTSNNLASSAKIAEASVVNGYSFQTRFARTDENINDIMTFSNLLDKGELTVRNPNATEKEVKLIMIIENAIKDDIEDIEIKIDDATVDTNKAIAIGDNLEIEIEDCSISGYSNYKGVVAFYGDPYRVSNFNYSFRVTEKL